MWDREAAIGGTGKVSDPVAAFAGTLSTRVRLCGPRDPESKGVIERANGYFGTSFLPGRTFTSPADFNDQLTNWLTIANSRLVRSTGRRPVDALAEDVAAAIALPGSLSLSENLLMPSRRGGGRRSSAQPAPPPRSRSDAA